MGIITKEVEVKPNGKMIQYYKDKGYDAKRLKPLMVKVKDLPQYSTAEVIVLCDMCKKHTMPVVYENYNSVIERTGNYVCKDCAYKKVKKTVQDRYNVDYVSQAEKFKKKAKETMMKKYNVEHALQNDVFKKRARKTTKERYGVEHVLQSPEVRQRVNKTLCNNGIRKTSTQQLYLHSLYGGEINYPIKYYAADICFPEEKIYVEYSGGGHFLRVILGALTQEEFDEKEIIRNEVIKREGYKKIEIVSSQDSLPSDALLLEMLDVARKYFSETFHSWIKFDIDNSRMINAENKDSDGVFFDFGELRKIKKSDMPEKVKTA